MSLSSLELDAFIAVSRAQNFSAAAKLLHVTQSALSQRIAQLEETLELTLFVRLPRGARLTEAGQRLLGYCQMKEALEAECLRTLRGDQSAEAGMVRIGAYSSVMRSVVLPVVGPFLRDRPAVQIDFISAEMRELPSLLSNGSVDMILSDTQIDRAQVTCEPVGVEDYVLIESRHHIGRRDTYLDHDPEDNLTLRFFAHQERTVKPFRRAYLDHIDAIIDGVALGLGRAVVPKHLLKSLRDLRVVRGYRSLETPVFLQYEALPFRSKLQLRVLDLLRAGCRQLLQGPPTLAKTRGRPR